MLIKMKRIFSAVTVLFLCLLANLGVSSNATVLPLNIQKKSVDNIQNANNFTLYSADALLNQAKKDDEKLSYHCSHCSHCSHRSHFSSRF